MSNCSVIIPVYRSEKSIPILLEKLANALPNYFDEYEVILVNDCSPDNSWNVITSQLILYPWLRGINLMRNYGQHNALLCGIRHASYEIIITMDDDLQHSPDEIKKLLEKFDEGYDVVYGTPETGQHGFFRNMASRITKLVLQNAMGAETAGKVSAFRIFRTHIREAFIQFNGSYVSIDVLLTWGSTRFASIAVREEQRVFGKSNYTLPKLLTHALNMMTGFSVLPLQIASLMGFGLAFFSILVLVFVIGRVILQGTPVPGFPFLASIIGLFSGAQLLSLGIIGEYLARIHFRIQDRPPYVVRESLSTEQFAGSIVLQEGSVTHE
jgi:glycosyltransferase involved in cell wall biosynthesis